jgi:hydroxymethylglutaryl-CoA reductase
MTLVKNMKVVRLRWVDTESVVRCRSEDKLNADGIDKVASHFIGYVEIPLYITGYISSLVINKIRHVFINVKRYKYHYENRFKRWYYQLS